MSDSLFKITPTPPTEIKLEPGREGTLSFTLESLAAPDKSHDLVLQALLVGEDGKGKEVEWLVAGPERTLHMIGGETETVAITAKPTPAGPRGALKVKLVVADKDRPNDVFAESSAVGCEVVAPTVAPPRRRPPWWLFAIIAGAVVAVAVIIILIWKLASGGGGGPRGVGEACVGGAGECDEGLVCDSGSRTCLLRGGAPCKPGEAKLCASGECKAEVCAVPLGEPCDPGARDVVPCPSNSACDPTAKRCLGNVGAPCKADAACATGRCAGGACELKAAAQKPGDPCEGSCPAPLLCSATTKRCVEQVGRPCTIHDGCATGLCEASVCAAPALLRDCTGDGICGPDQKCVEVQPNLRRCVWRPGHACASGAECSSKWCSQHLCTRDDGRCDAQSDCPSPYLCITSKQRCLLPVDQLCGGHAMCDSGYCKNNRCAPSPCVPACTGRTTCNNDPSHPKCTPWRSMYYEPREVPWTVRDGAP